jgi:hypothetical protein
MDEIFNASYILTTYGQSMNHKIKKCNPKSIDYFLDIEHIILFPGGINNKCPISFITHKPCYER